MINNNKHICNKFKIFNKMWLNGKKDINNYKIKLKLLIMKKKNQNKNWTKLKNYLILLKMIQRSLLDKNKNLKNK